MSDVPEKPDPKAVAKRNKQVFLVMVRRAFAIGNGRNRKKCDEKFHFNLCIVVPNNKSIFR